MSVNLYDLTTDVLKLEAMLDEGMDDDGLAEALAEAMDGAEGALTDKVENYVRLLRNWDATSAMIKDEEKRLAARRQVVDNKSRRLKDRLLNQLQRMDAPKLTTSIATVSRKKGSESTIIDDEMELPQGYFTTDAVIKADKAALKQLWKDTPEDERAQLPGFHIERGAESLAIR